MKVSLNVLLLNCFCSCFHTALYMVIAFVLHILLCSHYIFCHLYLCRWKSRVVAIDASLVKVIDCSKEEGNKTSFYARNLQKNVTT